MNKEDKIISVRVMPKGYGKASEDVRQYISDLVEEVEYKELWRKEYKQRIDKAIRFIDVYTNGINLEAFDCLKLMYRIKDILQGDDSSE